MRTLYERAIGGEEISMHEAYELLQAIKREKAPWYRAVKASFDRSIMATVSPLTIGIDRWWDKPPVADPVIDENDYASAFEASTT